MRRGRGEDLGRNNGAWVGVMFVLRMERDIGNRELTAQLENTFADGDGVSGLDPKGAAAFRHPRLPSTRTIWSPGFRRRGR